MRGAWKPALTYGSLPVVIFVVFAARDGALAWQAYAGMLVGVVPIVALVSQLAVMLGGSFVRGLRDAGEVVEVERDEVGWFGDRTIIVRGVQGAWHIHASAGRAPRVDVLGPRDETSWRVTGNGRKAARAAVERATGGGASAPPPRVITKPKLFLYTAVFFGMFVFLGLAFAGPKGAAWTAAVLAPFFMWIAWKIRQRARPVLQDSSGRVLDP